MPRRIAPCKLVVEDAPRSAPRASTPAAETGVARGPGGSAGPCRGPGRPLPPGRRLPDPRAGPHGATRATARRSSLPLVVGVDVGAAPRAAAATGPAPSLPRRVPNTPEGVAARTAALAHLGPALLVLDSAGTQPIAPTPPC